VIFVWKYHKVRFYENGKRHLGDIKIFDNNEKMFIGKKVRHSFTDD
jgi:hypothetical protein